MVTVCQTCGDEGFTNALIFCDECEVYAMHRYCLPTLPATLDEYVVWLCDDCEFDVNLEKRAVRRKVDNYSPTESKVSSIEKSSSIEIHDVDCLKTIEKDEESGREDVLEKDISNEVIESLESKNSKLNLQPLETSCTDDGKKDEKLAQLHVLDEGSIIEEAECIKDIVVVMPSETKFSDDGEERQKLERMNSMNENQPCKEIEKLNGSNECSLHEEDFVHAQPIQEPIWRGSLNILDKDHSTVVGLVAHVSNLACLKVIEEAKSMPASLSPELLPRSTVWPKGFVQSRPNDNSIALYFFPESVRKENVFDSLVNEMINQDVAMRIVLQNAELLIFSSTMLPLEIWRFQAKFYLWGVFKGKRSPPVAVDAIREENQHVKALPGINRDL